MSDRVGVNPSLDGTCKYLNSDWFRNVTARCGGQILIIVTKSSRLVIDRIED